MKSLVCPELSTASVGSSQAPTAAVDNSAPFAFQSSWSIIRFRAAQRQRLPARAALARVRVGRFVRPRFLRRRSASLIRD